MSVAVGVTDAEGAPLLAAYSSTFTTRDGAWKTIDAAAGSFTRVSDALPSSATGNALLAWGLDSGDGCPATAGWFRLAAPVGKAMAFDSSDSDCNEMTAGGNAAGIGAVGWLIPDSSAGALAQRFRGGAWLAKNAYLSKDIFLTMPRVAVSPTGMVTFLAHDAGGGTTAWRTDTSGNWVATGDSLSSDEATSAASIAFDSAGNGMAVWAATTSAKLTEMLYSKYTIASAKWSKASVIPDSVAKAHVATDHAPSLFMTSDGAAMVVWAQTSFDDLGDHILASLYSPLSGWAADAVGLTAYGWVAADGAPAAGFDGHAFVAAWIARPTETDESVCGAANCTYVARYDLKGGAWGSAAALQTKTDDQAAAKMPRLGHDGRGNGMLVWAKASGVGASTLVYQRYVAGKWSAITSVPGGTVADKNFGTTALPFSMNDSGMAALAWGNYEASGLISTIRFASFY